MTRLLGLPPLAELITLVGQDPFSETGPLAYEREQPAFLSSLAAPSLPPDLRGFLDAREHYIATFTAVMDRHHLDTLVFPRAVSEAPLVQSDDIIDSTTVSQINIGGFPGITIPAGYYRSGTPFGIMFVGRLWDEAKLLELAYIYEQSTHVRRVPVLVLRPGELNNGK